MNILKSLTLLRQELRGLTYAKLHRGLDDVEGMRNAENVFMAKTMDIKNKIEVWRDYGCKTFHLTQNLINAFVNTDLPKGITINQIPMPFDAFIIESDGPMFRMPDIDHTSKHVDYVMFISDSLLGVEEPATLHNHLLKDSGIENNIGTMFTLTHDGNGYLNGGASYINRDVPIDEICKRYGRSSDDEEMVSEIQGSVSSCLNLLFNTILYINDNSRVIEDTETHINRSVKLGGGRRKSRHYIYLRRPRHVRKYENEAKKRVINARFRVRGHWRMQPYGEGRLLRRSKWIPPFWKGPSASEIVSNPHKVE